MAENRKGNAYYLLGVLPPRSLPKRGRCLRGSKRLGRSRRISRYLPPRLTRNEIKQVVSLNIDIQIWTCQYAPTSGKLHPSGASGARHARCCQTSIFDVAT